MKQIKFMAFCLAAAMMSCSLTACSNDDDDDDNGGNGAAATVKPESVFTAGMPSKINNVSITTGANGLVTNLTYSEDGYSETYKFSYEPVTYKGKNFDASIECTSNESRAEESMWRFYVNLNDKGFVTYAYQEYVGESDFDEWWFGYNNDGQLNYMKRSEGDNEETTITYTDGNITKVSTVELDNPQDTPYVVSIEYTSDTHTSPIPNKGCIMLFDETFEIDMDEFAIVYYAGMLGKPTKNLPLYLREVSDEDYYQTYDWTLNADGLPVSMRPTYYSPYGDPEPGYETYNFSW